MPTENRSSNTEMVSVTREHELKIRQTPLADLLSGLKTGEIRDCSDREFAVGDTVLLREIDDAREYTGTVLRRTITHVQKHYGLPDHLCVLSYGQPATQPHPEPIAWMVGTAIWWTKEEAERDAAEVGQPVVGLGPMTGAVPSEQHQGEPVGEVVAFGKGLHEIAWAAGRMPKLGAKLYTNVDHGEVERLRADLATVKADRDAYAQNAIDLRGQLAEAQEQLRAQDDLLSEAYQHDIGTPLKRKIRDAALSASAEPSAHAWTCQPCKIEHPTDRPCDACGGASELKI